MFDSALSCSSSSGNALRVSDLETYAKEWLMDGEIAQHSKDTLANRRLIIRNLLWFLRREKFETVGHQELRRFFRYFHNAHEEAGGRWGNPQEKTPVKPSTVASYHRHIRTFFRWLVAGEYIASSPMEKIAPPIDRPDEIQPFSEEQVSALVKAAQETLTPKRDVAILLFLLDTGVRLTELCGLRRKDIDLPSRTAHVVGKGNKARNVPMGLKTLQALRDYLKEEKREEDDPIFLSKRGEALRLSGVQQLIDRLGDASEVRGVRCSPHTFRHTFAVLFLRNGGNQFTLMRILGHTDLRMTSRYVSLAQADIENQHRAYSPVDNMKKIPLRRTKAARG